MIAIKRLVFIPLHIEIATAKTVARTPVAPFIPHIQGRLEIHFPGKPLEDPKRNLSIGNYPDSELRIDVVNGGLL